jgi:hypothetical protein
MVCSNCKRLLLETSIRYSHITQGNIRTCPQLGGFLYVKPVHKVTLSQFNTQIILHISSYINYFQSQTILPLISKKFNIIKNTIPKSIKRTINMKKKFYMLYISIKKSKKGISFF